VIEIQAKIQIEGKDTHIEKLPVNSLETAEEEVKAMIENFNKNLWPGEKPRKFIEIIKGGEKLLHNWERQNLVTQRDKYGLYDTYICKNCGLKQKRRSISRPLPTACYPDRTCTICNKVFKSKKNLIRHQMKKHEVT